MKPIYLFLIALLLYYAESPLGIVLLDAVYDLTLLSNAMNPPKLSCPISETLPSLLTVPDKQNVQFFLLKLQTYH